MVMIVKINTYRLVRQKKQLEQTVNDRTVEIIRQKAEIEKQAKVLKSANEKLVALDEFKEGMTGMIVHDLKNPLNGIINVSKSFSAEQQVQRMKQTGMQMLNLVLNILDVYKYEEAKMIVDKFDYSLLSISNDALTKVAYLADQKHIKIENSISELTEIKADREIIERVFVNFLTNAIKYTPNNGRISLLANQIDSSNDVRVEIIDTGSGIPESEQHKVFDKFRQIEAKKSGAVRSTGLGLTFCKLAVEAHGGVIGVESKKENGTNFWFTLPVGKTGTLNPEPTLSRKGVFLASLSENDKKIIQPLALEFEKYEIYEISILRKLLKEVEAIENERIKDWKEAMSTAIGNGNENRYIELISEVLRK
jgi:signal transduction histidine kinase